MDLANSATTNTDFSRYFECDESEDESSEDSEYSAQYQPEPVSVQQCEDDDDDEVFIDTPPDDSTSCELLLSQEPVPRVSPVSPRVSEEDDDMQLEVAAGTPVLLNYLLTHPVTCSVQ
ncbi:uncharacterized protein LOC135084781 [Ostrinia nubilalis]|uniref:uncharacterized protein LOC135084781 n=1 Tax=Ostrinia nubilalis TaxID=29057 RepID=UPI0030822C3C